MRSPTVLDNRGVCLWQLHRQRLAVGPASSFHDTTTCTEVVPLAVELRRRANACSGGIPLGGCDSSDGLVEGDAQRRQVQMAIDAAELLGCLAHAGGDPAQHHLPVLPAPDVDGMVAADLDHRLDGVGAAQRSSEGGWYAQP